MNLAMNSSPVRIARMGKREQRWNDPTAHAKLRKLYEERVVPIGMTQEQFGELHGIGNQSMVWQYLSGRVPLSLEAAGRFAKGLKCHIVDFSPLLAEQLKADILPVLGPRSWWKGAGKAIVLAAFLGVIWPPSTSHAHATFFSQVAAVVSYVKYYVKSMFRLWMVRFRTAFVKRQKLTFAQ